MLKILAFFGKIFFLIIKNVKNIGVFWKNFFFNYKNFFLIIKNVKNIGVFRKKFFFNYKKC
ncbi:MAG: hypothetical protein B6I24_02685 [Bacteroidetes bacterium 4572_128]|nr:MAG: hypothetical protein B6I24_02685 [Bacteroidetes bacterium 4572_128]